MHVRLIDHVNINADLEQYCAQYGIWSLAATLASP